MQDKERELDTIVIELLNLHCYRTVLHRIFYTLIAIIIFALKYLKLNNVYVSGCLFENKVESKTNLN